MCAIRFTFFIKVSLFSLFAFHSFVLREEVLRYGRFDITYENKTQ